ncbi:MAG: PDZ domain-containing protein [Sphingomonadaceae bacterium]|nr:PDZ domain-containing protein [Sphingomonadaceae bacterium]
MRLSLDARAQRLVRRLPRTTIYSALEILLLTVLAVQCARLVWAVVTPVGPLGDWRSDGGMTVLATPDSAYFESFDPFFRLEGGGAVVVTDLNLQLFGIREDRATGRGSAIIATPDGEQNSYLVGDEVMPGVILHAVDFDSITIERGGVRETVFLDQSSAPPVPSTAAAAPVIAPTATPSRTAPAQATTPQTVTPSQLARGTQISPRREGNRLTGIILQPTDDGSALASAGFQPGDVIVAIDGEPIQDMGQAATFATRMASGNAMVQVERGGETVSVRARVAQ